MTPVTRVAIVDSHPATAEGLAAILSAVPRLEVVGTAHDDDGALALVATRRPDIVLCDVQPWRRSARLEMVARWRRTSGPRVIVFSSQDAPGLRERALAAGAQGYLPKTASIEEIVAAIRSVAEGSEPAPLQAAPGAPPGPRRPTKRELEVIECVAAGRSNQETAERLGIARKSVEGHLRRLFERYGVVSRTEVAMLAVRQGWLDAASLPLDPAPRDEAGGGTTGR